MSRGLRDSNGQIVINEKKRLKAFPFEGKVSPPSGSPKSPCFLGRGGAATRGQGIPTGYTYRVRRATTR